MSGSETDFSAMCNRIAEQLYSAKINQGTIPKDMYEATAGELMDAVFNGLGKQKTFTYEDPRNLLVAHLRQNIYAYSAAKSLTEMKVFNDLMIDKDGKLKPFKQYRDDVAKAGYTFNVNHLQIDYNTALASAQVAQSFNEFGPDDYIEVRTTGAENVCPICGQLNGFTRLKSATIWATFCPPFHQQCNCKLIPGQHRNVRKHDAPLKMLREAGVKPYFQSNPAINKVVFTDDYPHMQNLKKGTPLHWDKAYNLPSLDRIYMDKLPTPVTLNTKAAANEWWTQRTGTKKGEFLVKDKLGTVIKVDNKFRNHVFEQNKEARFTHLANLDEILQDPDEIWSTKTKKGNLITTYIRYYDNFPYCVQVDDDRAFTMMRYDIMGTGKPNEKSLEQDRSGVLLHRNN
ncbi:hypothetical protein CJD36_019930 [Flavipsychrobacter stenotrophus]|uniref:Phage-Barnase-EndoU-ColicinE5/D-RelE like nuclease 2 domain-containing protein n=2 Tax=Flavipsychrobacter stenotrophus TaxID=2077091 RepID=A0A2S7SRH2_9BACT|nr:hypothetical protein CJD36_019930 [Flavipsychrobacter stenotrophus]